MYGDPGGGQRGITSYQLEVRDIIQNTINSRTKYTVGWGILLEERGIKTSEGEGIGINLDLGWNGCRRDVVSVAVSSIIFISMPLGASSLIAAIFLYYERKW